MISILRTVAALLVLVLAGCISTKPPPGWPTGEERPINPSNVTKAAR